MSKWSDLYGYGLEELLRKRLLNYTYASFMFCYIEPSSEGGPLCILQFENTVHSYAERTSLSSLLSLNS